MTGARPDPSSPRAPRVGVVCRDVAARAAETRVDGYLIAAGGRATWREGTGERAEQVTGAGQLVAVVDAEGQDAEGAATAATTTARALVPLWQRGMGTDPAGELLDWLASSHTRLYWRLGEKGVAMGASLAAVWVDGGRAAWVEVGTARVWRWRDGRLSRLGRDREHFDTQRFLGGSTGLGDDTALHLRRGVNVGLAELVAGDQLLVATDGLWRVVDEASAAQVLSHTDPQVAAVHGMERAVARGTTDHVTVVVLDARAQRVAIADPGEAPRPPRRPLRKDPPPVRPLHTGKTDPSSG